MTPDPYQCQHCGTWYVVRILARDCEAKHQQPPPAPRSTP